MSPNTTTSAYAYDSNGTRIIIRSKGVIGREHQCGTATAVEHLRIVRPIGNLTKRQKIKIESAVRTGNIHAFTVTLPLYNRAHENLNRPNIRERHLALVTEHVITSVTISESANTRLTLPVV